MLLIDPGRTASSLRPNAVPFAYVMKDFRGDAAHAWNFLAQALDMEKLAPVLVREMSLVPGIGRVLASVAPLVLREAAAVIARGALPVGQKLPERVAILTDTAVDTLVHAERAVRFASERTALAFLTACARDNRLTGLSDDGTAKVGGGKGDGLEAIARALMNRSMALIPTGASLNTLRLVRVRHNVPPKSKEEAGAPPPPPSNPIAQLAQMARSALPELPADISAQAQTLLDAAKNGVPFCEECARAAAGLLGV